MAEPGLLTALLQPAKRGLFCGCAEFMYFWFLTGFVLMVHIYPDAAGNDGRPIGHRSLHNSESSRRDPGQSGTARVTNFTPHAGSGTCRAPTCEHATLCSHPMRRQLRQRAVVGKPGRRTARPKFGNTELSAQPTVASNGGQEHAKPKNYWSHFLRGGSGITTGALQCQSSRQSTARS